MHDADELRAQTNLDSPLTWEPLPWPRRVVDRLVTDLRGPRYVTVGVLVALVTTLVLAASYANNPQPVVTGDSQTYLQLVRQLLLSGGLINPLYMPGYPLFIALVYLVAGQGNLVAVGAAQAVLCVVTAIEIYALTCLLLRRAWAAGLVALLVGGNIILLGFAKLLSPESLSIWLVATLALAVAVYLRRMSIRNLWLVAGCMLALMLTQAVWIAAPIPLFAYLLWAAWRRGALQRVLPDMLAAVVVLCAVITIFVAVNANQNGYTGTSCLQNVDLLGKVMQYRMQSEAPAQYSGEVVIVSAYVAQGDPDPWDVIRDHPEFASNCYALAGAYAGSIVQQHPIEFAARSVPVAISSLTTLTADGPQISPSGPFAGVLAILRALATGLYWLGWLLIPCAVFWTGLAGLRRTGRVEIVQVMMAILLLALYGVGATAVLGSGDYGSLNAPIEPLVLVVAGTTSLVVCFVLFPLVWRPEINRQPRQGISWISALRGTMRAIGHPTQRPKVPATQHALRTRLRPVAQPARDIRAWGMRVTGWIRSPYVVPGALLVMISGVVVAAFYLNHPAPETFPDTPSYTNVAQQILAHLQPVDDLRMPGYPMLIALIYLLAGFGNLTAVEIAQAVLFLLAVIEIYALACLVLRRRWGAFAVGMLVGANLTLITFIKPILSESIALWLTVTLALATALFVRSVRARNLWLVGAVAIALLITRSEWEYIIVPLLGYLLVVAAHRGRFLRLLPHAVVIVALFYGVVWGYSAANAARNGYDGLTIIPRVDLLGKVMQYHMQNEAPPEYASTAAIVDAYVQRGDLNPFDVLSGNPDLEASHWAPAGDYATAIIVRHPVEFVADSIPLAYTSLGTQYYNQSELDPAGPYYGPLRFLLANATWLYRGYRLFPFCALVWVLLLIWPRTRHLRSVEMMGGAVLLPLYGVSLITLAVNGSYARLFTPYDPLMIVVIAIPVIIACELLGSWILGLGSVRLLLQSAGHELVSTVRSASPSRRAPVLAAGAPETLAPARPTTWEELSWELPASRQEDASVDTSEPL